MLEDGWWMNGGELWSPCVKLAIWCELSQHFWWGKPCNICVFHIYVGLTQGNIWVVHHFCDFVKCTKDVMCIDCILYIISFIYIYIYYVNIEIATVNTFKNKQLDTWAHGHTVDMYTCTTDRPQHPAPLVRWQGLHCADAGGVGPSVPLSTWCLTPTAAR